MGTRLLLVGVLYLTAAVAQGADDPAVKEIKALSDAYIEAIKAQNKTFFEDTFSDRLVVVGKDGNKSDKKQCIKDLLDPKVTFKSLTCTDVDVRVFGDTAIETGKQVAVGKADGEEFRTEMRYTDVWVKEKGKWKLVSEHVSDIKEP